MMTKIKLLMLIIFYLIISASAHAAGGIALGATRIIYPLMLNRLRYGLEIAIPMSAFWSIRGLKTAAV